MRYTVDIAVKSAAGGQYGSFEGVMSAPTLDRDGEVIDPRAFDPLPARIPVDIDHGMSVLATIGSGVPYYDGDMLKIIGSFASTERAQDVRKLVTEGHIDRMSIAFMNPQRKTSKDGVTHVVKGELLSVAIVAIPSNRESAITAAKAWGRSSVQDLVASAYADLAAVQLHDAQAYLGRIELADADAALVEARSLLAELSGPVHSLGGRRPGGGQWPPPFYVPGGA